MKNYYIYIFILKYRSFEKKQDERSDPGNEEEN